jgi:hypothetical protein
VIWPGLPFLVSVVDAAFFVKTLCEWTVGGGERSASDVHVDISTGTGIGHASINITSTSTSVGMEAIWWACATW